jgi:hypothetical protein
MADGDHPFAPGHDRVVGVLQAHHAQVVGAMEGGDEMGVGMTGGVKGAPRRRTRPGMDDVDAVGLDDLLQAGDIGPHHQGILAVQGQGDMLDSQPIQFPHHMAAVGGDQGRPAGLGQGRGQIDGSPFDAARDQGRQNLQDNGFAVGQDNRWGFI